jgi:hypothetical protein
MRDKICRAFRKRRTSHSTHGILTPRDRSRAPSGRRGQRFCAPASRRTQTGRRLA